MKTEKKQFCNRMNAAIMLLALACVNVLMDTHRKKINHQIMTVIPRKKGIVMSC